MGDHPYVPSPTKPPFSPDEVVTERAAGEKARHAGAILDAYEGLATSRDRADMVELVVLFATAGQLRRTILRVVRAIVTGA